MIYGLFQGEAKHLFIQLRKLAAYGYLSRTPENIRKILKRGYKLMRCLVEDQRALLVFDPFDPRSACAFFCV